MPSFSPAASVQPTTGVTGPARSATSTVDSVARRLLGTKGVGRLDTPLWAGQCVSLVARYVQDVHLRGAEKTRSRSFGDGYQTARRVASMLPGAFYPFVEASNRTSLPHEGAVLSFRRSLHFPMHGHTAVVVATRQTSKGREVKLLQSNVDNRGADSVVGTSPWLCIDDKTIYGRVAGWTNPR